MLCLHYCGDAFLMNSCNPFTDIIKVCFTGVGATYGCSIASNVILIDMAKSIITRAPIQVEYAILPV